MCFPPVPAEMIDAGYELFAERFNPILDVRRLRRAVRSRSPSDRNRLRPLYPAERMLAARSSGARSSASTSIPVICSGRESIRSNSCAFPDRIYHVHVKDAIVTLNGRSVSCRSHLNFGDPRRGWDFRSPGAAA